MYSSYSIAAAVCSVIFPTLASLAVVLRFQARKRKSLKYGTDDYVIVVALCLSISLCCIVLYGSCRAGFGQDLSTMTPAEYVNYDKHLYVAVIWTALSEGATKIAVISFYKRIFSTLPSFRLAANVTLALIWGWILAAVFIFSAWPVSNWFRLPTNFDLDYGAQTTAFATLDVALDIFTLCLPIPVIKHLHISRRRKITLVAIFWLGLFCIVAGAVRLYFGYKLSTFRGVVVRNSYYSYVSINLVIWSEIEPCMSIVAACLPTFGPLVQGGLSLQSLARSFQSRVFKKRASTSTGSEQRANVRWPASAYTPRSDGLWNRLEDDKNNTSHAADIELGERKAQSDRWLDQNEVPRVKQAWIQQNYPSYNGNVEMGKPELRTEEVKGIRVENSFGAESVQGAV